MLLRIYVACICSLAVYTNAVGLADWGEEELQVYVTVCADIKAKC